MQGQKVWNNILLGIKSSVTASTFKTWFSGSFALDCSKEDGCDVLIVGLKNNFIKEQVETRYLPLILKTAREKGINNWKPVFVVAQKEKGEPLKDEPIFSGVPKLVFESKNTSALMPNYNFGNFVVGPSNNLAYAAANHAVSNPGAYNPLLIYGPTGVGKTHLLQAIGNDILAKSTGAKVVWAGSEKFTNDYIESLYNKTQAAFRAKYRTANLLLVDDVQFLCGKDSTQEEFFHTFNEISMSGGQLVVVCDRHPRELNQLKERLISRLRGGMVVDIGLPDLEMKMAILATKCRGRGAVIGNEIIEYIAKECAGGARELEGVLVSVLGLMKLSGNNLTIEDVGRMLGSGKTIVNVDPKNVFEAVCKYYKVNSSDLKSSSRKASLVWARQVLMYLFRKKLGLPLVAIGQYIGGKDHSTVIHGIGKVEKLIGENQSLKDEVLRVETFFHNNPQKN